MYLQRVPLLLLRPRALLHLLRALLHLPPLLLRKRKKAKERNKPIADKDNPDGLVGVFCLVNPIFGNDTA